MSGNHTQNVGNVLAEDIENRFERDRANISTYYEDDSDDDEEEEEDDDEDEVDNNENRHRYHHHKKDNNYINHQITTREIIADTKLAR